jgi:hypothetical protein
MNIIDTIRTLRKERNMSFDDAKIAAIKFFEMKGWPLPEWAQRDTTGQRRPAGEGEIHHGNRDR